MSGALGAGGAVRDFRDRPGYRPWSRDLYEGDRLSHDQRDRICGTRLADFGLMTLAHPEGGYVVISYRVEAAMSALGDALECCEPEMWGALVKTVSDALARQTANP